MGLDLFLLGPGAGMAIGLISVAVLDLVRRKSGVRRDYESLYSLGVAFAAYAAAESVHGSGFLAAFSAGLVIAMLDVELCDCFLEYGETTAEMALLFTFVLFGSSLIWSGLSILNLQTILFIFAVLLARPVAFLISLARSKLGFRERLFIGWFGPRGLSSLLLILLPVFAGIQGSEELFAICCAVVLFSVVLHGGSLMIFRRRATSPQPPPTQTTFSVEKSVASSVSDSAESSSEGSITIQEMLKLKEQNHQLYILDVRADRSYESSNLHAVGAIRIHPDEAVRRVSEMNLSKDAWLIAFCA